MINLGWMMYLLDRNEIFNQFNIIYNKLNNGGYLSVIDFQPNFPHTNINEHSGKFRSYKTDYSIFLESSNLFKEIYSIAFVPKMASKIKFIDKYISIKIYKKQKFEEVFQIIYDFIKIKKSIRQNKSKFFLLGSLSGTTITSRLIASCKNVAYLYEQTTTDLLIALLHKKNSK